MALNLSVCDTGEESLFNNACVICSRSVDSLWNHLCRDVESLLSIQLSIDNQSPASFALYKYWMLRMKNSQSFADENSSWSHPRCPQEGLESVALQLNANVVRVSLQMSNRSNYFNASAGGHLGDFSLKAWPPSSCSSALPFSLRESAVLAVGASVIRTTCDKRVEPNRKTWKQAYMLR